MLSIHFMGHTSICLAGSSCYDEDINTLYEQRKQLNSRYSKTRYYTVIMGNFEAYNIILGRRYTVT